jgi:hypothetical protein
VKARIFLVSVLLATTLPLARAQSPDSYENEALGVAFDLLPAWTVQTPDANSLLAATPEDLELIARGGVARGLAVRLVFGTFIEMNIQRASELPDKLVSLTPARSRIGQVEAAVFGNAQGWQVEYTVEDSNFTTLAGLVALENGRLALIRAVSISENWESAKADFEIWRQSLVFSLPAALRDPFAGLPSADGGVLWRYQARQPEGMATVTLGGLTYDPFLLMYVAAGPRGILVLDQTNGAFINYLGPFFNDDNFVDVAISTDARLFVANATPGDNNHVMVVNRAGSYESGFGSSGDGAGQFAPNMPRTLAVTRRAEVWVVSEGHSTPPVNRLYQFDRFGTLLKTVDLDALNPDLKNIRLDNNLRTGGLYLVGESGGLNLLNSEGEAIVTRLATSVFEVAPPTDIAIAPSDNIIIATRGAGILEFAPSGALLDRFGLIYDPARTDAFQVGEFLNPTGLVVTLDGIIHTAETNPTGYSHVQSLRLAGDGALSLGTVTGEAEAEPPPDPATGGGNIAYGDVVRGSLNNRFPAHNWIFEGAPGDRIRITMRSLSSPEEALDTRLVLTDPNLIEIAQNDDLAGPPPEGLQATDSLLELELRAFGFYTIRATRFGGRGMYELRLEKLN